MQVGPVRHTITIPRKAADGPGMLPGSAPGGRPTPVLHVHPTGYHYTGDASPTAPGGMAIIYKDLVASDERTRQVIADVTVALAQGRNCLVLTNWTGHLEKMASALRELGHDPVILRGGMGAKTRAAALARLTRRPGGPPLLAGLPARTPGKGSTARHWTPCSSPRPSPTRAASCSTPEGSFAPTTARPPPRSTTTTTSSPAFSPHHWPSGHPATPAWASPTPASSPTPPALAPRAPPRPKDQQHEANRSQAHRHAIRPDLRD